MTVVVTNETKHSAVVSSINKYGVALWDDVNVSWDDSLFTWDNISVTTTNETKHSAIITNQSKS